MLETFLDCCCFDSVILCDTNSVNTSSFEIAEINILNASRTPHLSLQPGLNRNGNERGNATLILTHCDTWVLPCLYICGHKNIFNVYPVNPFLHMLTFHPEKFWINKFYHHIVLNKGNAFTTFDDPIMCQYKFH